MLPTQGGDAGTVSTRQDQCDALFSAWQAPEPGALRAEGVGAGPGLAGLALRIFWIEQMGGGCVRRSGAAVGPALGCTKARSTFPGSNADRHACGSDVPTFINGGAESPIGYERLFKCFELRTRSRSCCSSCSEIVIRQGPRSSTLRALIRPPRIQ